MFFADLVRKIKHPLVTELVKVSSYKGESSTGQITIEGGLNLDNFKGKNVLVI